ncbi:hypothetical protein ABMA28_005553 [Loxostege sticticalis]|uniref:C2H2-type domain-containing protein n=1 Tax=Loxostege sticticalis TaxID=481309 RepID=A0ABD0SPD4_LOXSC
MEPVKVCRICLIMDVKMYDLRLHPLDHYSKSIKTMTSLDLLPYACFECAALIKNAYFFREKCMAGETALYSVMDSMGMLTEQNIRTVDRQKLNLVSSLICQNICMDSTIHITYEEPEMFAVKDELSTEDIGDDEPKYDMDLDFFKHEMGGDDIHFSSDDDNKPLVLHKSNKEKLKQKTSKKGKKKKADKAKLPIKDTIEFEEVSFNDDPEVPDPPEDPPTRRTRGRPRKDTAVAVPAKTKVTRTRRTANTGGVQDDDGNMEEYVTIISLSKEEQLAEIEKRKHSSNYMNALFKCNLCYKGFIDDAAWKHHLSRHEPRPGDVECEICRFRFKNKRHLSKHVSNHEKKYACKACPYVSKCTTQAKQHQRWHKGVTYKCQHCDEVLSKWTSYLSHLRLKHPSEFICGICGYSFVSKLGLTMHKSMMHKDELETEEADGDKSEGGPYCVACEVKFISLQAYRRHMVTSAKHTMNQDFKNGCRVCGETLGSAEELRLHHRRLHARKRPKNYGKKPCALAFPAVCPHCPETIVSAREYWVHFRRAHPDKPYPIQKNYVCDICGKSFRGNAFLTYHKRTHSEERAYKCTQCPKAFFNRTNLQMHEKTHSDVRPYPCTVCFKAFKAKGALDRHYRSHTGEKPYECEVCGKGFGQSNSRKLHVLTVHLKQPAPYVSRARLERTRNKPLY